MKESYTKKEVEDILVKLYIMRNEPSYVAVAEICDTELDRSGGLLGRVRDGAYQIESASRS